MLKRFKHNTDISKSSATRSGFMNFDVHLNRAYSENGVAVYPQSRISYGIE